MALITCPECSAKISNLAQSCPHCGVPIAGSKDVTDAGVPLTTIQETSKKLKTQIAISAFMFWGGLLLFFLSVGKSPGWSIFLMLIIISGSFLYIGTKIQVWWHHK